MKTTTLIKCPIAFLGMMGLIAITSLSGCGRELAKIEDCVAKDGLVPVCGVQNPEDLAVLPGGRYVLSSQYGGTAGEKPAGLALYDSTVGSISKLGPFVDPSPELWGSPDCTTPPGAAFSSHGIELSQRDDGRWQVIAVNHGGRESLEWFELIEKPGSPQPISLAWRGCAVVLDGRSINAVATLPHGGGQLVSQIWQHAGPTSPLFATWNLLMSRFAMSSGAVLHWDGKQFTEVPGTRGMFPNGIVVSADGRYMYVNMEGYNQIQKIPVSGGKPVAVADVGGMPDNVRWSANRTTLYVASIRGSFSEMGDCMNLDDGACPMRGAVVAVDPESMKAYDLFEHEGAPMGGFTAAVELSDSLLIGAYASDRYLRVPKSKLANKQ
jgi:hypothetical protein